VKLRREAWHQSLSGVPVRNLVFLDESSATTSLARLYGRSPVGERLSGSSPYGHWMTVTMLCAVRLDGPIAPLLVDGAVDGSMFTAWLEQFLVRELRPGDVVVMDNLNTHRVAGVSKILERAGHPFYYLPPYSPDFNPIENMWSKVKSILRGLAARKFDELGDAMKTAILSVTEDDCVGFFNHCGYKSTTI
jgi:transposase